ncbi:MAG: DUF1294 domain-containing protein [Candidatus Ventricola sp.]
MLRGIWIVYLMLNVIAFSLFGLDKQRAKRGLWRIRESVLLAVIWLMGGVGAWLGMRLFRHKTQKRRFVISANVASVLQLALMALATIRLMA